MGICLDLGNEKTDGGTDEQVYNTYVGVLGLYGICIIGFSQRREFGFPFFLHGTESGFWLVFWV